MPPAIAQTALALMGIPGIQSTPRSTTRTRRHRRDARRDGAGRRRMLLDGDLSPSLANIGLEPDGNRFLAGAAPWY